jgi:hypothetical protein
MLLAVVYLRYVDDVARAHADSVGITFEAVTRLGAVPVVRRHDITYRRAGTVGDRLEVSTVIRQEVAREPRNEPGYRLRTCSSCDSPVPQRCKISRTDASKRRAPRRLKMERASRKCLAAPASCLRSTSMLPQAAKA